VHEHIRRVLEQAAAIHKGILQRLSQRIMRAIIGIDSP
jgi:hypothetical protein